MSDYDSSSRLSVASCESETSDEYPIHYSPQRQQYSPVHYYIPTRCDLRDCGCIHIITGGCDRHKETRENWCHSPEWDDDREPFTYKCRQFGCECEHLPTGECRNWEHADTPWNYCHM